MNAESNGAIGAHERRMTTAEGKQERRAELLAMLRFFELSGNQSGVEEMQLELERML